MTHSDLVYGSLGAVIILLTWFYISGLMLLFGAEINSQIEAAAAQLQLAGNSTSLPSPQTSNSPRYAALMRFTAQVDALRSE
jgi:membrane protein